METAELAPETVSTEANTALDASETCKTLPKHYLHTQHGVCNVSSHTTHAKQGLEHSQDVIFHSVSLLQRLCQKAVTSRYFLFFSIQIFKWQAKNTCNSLFSTFTTTMLSHYHNRDQQTFQSHTKTKSVDTVETA